MAEISKTERLLNLVSFLLKSRRPVSITEIRDSVTGYCDSPASAASVDRQFERDKAALRELGIPLKFVSESEAGGPGYIIPHEAYFLPRLEFSPAETAILSVAGRFGLTGAAGPVSDALYSALRKLHFDSPIPGGIRETAEERFLFHREPTTGNASEQANLRELTSGVLARHTVRFTYYGIGQNRVTRRTVEPYGLGFSNGHWYLVGRDRGRKAARVFRVDRIRGQARRAQPDATRQQFDVPDGFHIEDHVGVPPWLFGKARRVKVRMRFDADVAFMVRLRPTPADKWEEHRDGSITLTREASNPDALLNWVLGFGKRVQVLGPRDFRDRVIATLREVSAMHSRRPERKARQ